MTNLIFNPKYILKKDKGCVMILSKSVYDTEYNHDINFGMMNNIHSIHAAILSFFDGRNTDEAINEAAKFLNIDKSFIHNLVDKLANNKEDFFVNYNGISIIFPKNTLISSEEVPTAKYDASIFDYGNTDLFLKRHLTPTDITIMVNTRCATDCIYCYADRRIELDCKIPLPRIINLINEAKSFGARSFHVIGGEFFLYSKWEEVVQTLMANDYHPFISTKVPIGEKIVSKLKDQNIQYIQVSLDSFIQKSLKNILNISYNYKVQMEKTFRLLEKYGIKVFVHTVMNKINQNIEDVDALFLFLKQFTNIGYWRLDKAGASLYKGRGVYSYQTFKPNIDKLQEIINYIETNKLRDNCSFNIICEGLKGSESTTSSPIDDNIKYNKFNQRSSCSANTSNLFILPDGQVTICEELYWTPRYIIGNIMQKSLLEIWNSETAVNLFNISQDSFPEESPCKSCSMFHECRTGKGVCHRDILKAYGTDKWYYPDPKCPKALENANEFIV